MTASPFCFYNYILTMKVSLRTLLLILLVAGIACGTIASRYQPVGLRLGMKVSRVEESLRHLDAEDISDGMSTYLVVIPEDLLEGAVPRNDIETSTNSTGMWHVSKLNITVETDYDVDGRLSAINVWDWTGRELNSYHHSSMTPSPV